MGKQKSDKLEELKSSAEKVWLAGLGALAQAGKQGDKLFKSLVKKGKQFEDIIPAAGDSVKDSVEAAKKQATRTFTEMEAAFDRQVEKAIKRAGLARQTEVDALKKEVAALKKTKGKGASKKSTSAGKTRAAAKK